MGETDSALARLHRGGANCAADAGPLDFSAAEIRQLWSFLDGSIMALDTRQHLWRSWGLCPRHAWGYAVAEVEVHGGHPFSTGILYADLTRRAARVVGRRLAPWPLVRSRLRDREACFTCDYLAMTHEGSEHEGREQDEAMARRVNERTRTEAIFDQLGEVALDRACPFCLNGHGLTCRLHLMEQDNPPDRLADELWALARRLRALVGSLTTRRTTVGPLEAASWIEALGWFGGWDYARKLADERDRAARAVRRRHLFLGAADGRARRPPGYEGADRGYDAYTA
jgi:hypothetical protein